jgi:PAS domain-containing protein
VPHVELSLSEPAALRRRSARSSLGRWAKAVADAAESSLVIDAESVVVALSPACQEMFGLDRPAVGRPLLEVFLLFDFSNPGGALSRSEARKMPPLLALDSGQLARGLMRVQCREGMQTVDAIATPLRNSSGQVGSLTFFCPV